MVNPEAVVSKSRFAEICNVVPGRVTQWISEGKIGKEALVGEGRSAKIIVAVAQRQLRSRIDSGQAFGNGLNTKLSRPEPSRPPRSSEPADDPDADESQDPLDQQIKRERLEALQRTNRIAAAEEAAKQGFYTAAADARRQMTAVAAQVLRVFEGAIPEMADKLAAQFKIEERDVNLFLVGFLRDVRDEAAKRAQAAAEKLDATVPGAADDD